MIIQSQISSALSLPSEIRTIAFPGVVGVILLEYGNDVPAYGELSSYELRPVPADRPSKGRSNDRTQGTDAVIITR